MNKFKRDLDEFGGDSPRFKEPLKRKILSDMKRERRSPNRFGTFQAAAVLVLLLTVATLFLVLNPNGNGTDSSGPVGTPVLTDPNTVEEIERFFEVTEPQEVFDFGYDSMDRGNYDYYEYPLLIDPAAYQKKDVARGDVVIYETDLFDGRGQTVGRIVALPGESVEVIEGQLYINDQKLDTFYGRASRLGYSSNEEYNEAVIEGGTTQNLDSMKEIFSQSIETFTLGESEVYVTGDDWFRSRQEIVKVDEIQAEVLGYYVE
ncbi:S26 family signal peptidase [Metaplanococcus flavidus]|uniref:S26 family signal peptidase n=1 Tax=Metaplanococcus flavidus TaxID=569883 RepID=A0ABW3LCY8_9BACL